MQNLNSLATSIAEILKGNLQILLTRLAQGHTHLFFYWDLMMGFGKLQLQVNFKVAGFIYYGNIRELVYKRQIRFLRHPSEELDVTCGLYL